MLYDSIHIKFVIGLEIRKTLVNESLEVNLVEDNPQ